MNYFITISRKWSTTAIASPFCQIIERSHYYLQFYLTKTAFGRNQASLSSKFQQTNVILLWHYSEKICIGHNFQF